MNEAQVQLIADSVSPEGIRLTTFQLRYWRAIHSELMTHRVFSRNAGSSRARPSQAIIEQVRTNPWGPVEWGTNKPGMQAGDPLNIGESAEAEDRWLWAAQQAADAAQGLLDKGVHKQIVNRLLEPFTYIDVVLTATDFSNWFALRDHPDAQPEIQDLARRMKLVMDSSTPVELKHGEWHLPYIDKCDWKAAEKECQRGRITRDMPSYSEMLEIVRKVSVARCARVSYKAFDGTHSSIQKDLELFEKLLGSQPLHASPAEHQATPDFYDHDAYWRSPSLHGNLRGWIQYRKTLPNEFVKD